MNEGSGRGRELLESTEDIISYVAREGVEMVDLRYVDIAGRLRHVTLPAPSLSGTMLRHGIGFSVSSVGYSKTAGDDLVLVPDAFTAFLDPFCRRKTLALFCCITDPTTREPFSQDPRALAQRAESHLSSLGWVDKGLWGPELEFFVFEHVALDLAENHSGYRVSSAERIPPVDDQADGYHLRPMGGYHAMTPTDKGFDLRSEIAAYLEALGVPVKYHHHEVGATGEMEIELPMGGLLETADRVILTKYVAKMVGQRWGKSITFMPKPVYGDGANGMHVHQMLRKGGLNLFSDPEGYAGVSHYALWYTAGLLSHAPALLAFTNPSTNSYRRLLPGFQAPTNLFFSRGNRSAAVRIPGYATQHEDKRIEFRPPDATCNIYFALAAQLLAGLDGIARRMDFARFGPIDENVHEWPENKRKSLMGLPANFEQALEGLKQDRSFLQAGGVFPPELIDSWIDYKVRQELVPVQERPHPFELALYFDT